MKNIIIINFDDSKEGNVVFNLAQQLLEASIQKKSKSKKKKSLTDQSSLITIKKKTYKTTPYLQFIKTMKKELEWKGTHSTLVKSLSAKWKTVKNDESLFTKFEILSESINGSFLREQLENDMEKLSVQKHVSLKDFDKDKDIKEEYMCSKNNNS
jgi:Rps23 Pro-64 3,4-dihydroxylase Tpa1-like proline 4-hydroxylase